jgi:very-short-patch-repair endonuclease
VVELDSRGFHSDPRTFDTDRIKDARLQRLGLRVLRITWKRLKLEPQAVIDDVLALARLSGSGALDGLSLARH